MLKQITIYVISCMLIAILGCSKDEASTPTPPSPPPSENSFKIYNLVYSPSRVAIKPYAADFQMNGSVTFEYASGGIAKLRLTTSAGFDTTINIEGGAGQTTGVAVGYFTFTRPVIPVEFSFEIWLIDIKGNASNKLSGTVSVILDDSGQSWTRNYNRISEFQEVRWLNNRYIAVGNARSVSTSPEGITWTLQNLPPRSVYTSNTLWGVCWSGSTYVVVGDAGMILSSPDAVNWQDHTLPDRMPDFSSVAWGRNRFVTVAMGNYPIGNDIVYSSPDGATWDKSNITIPKATLKKVIWVGDIFIVVGSVMDAETLRPVILTSPDGIQWTTKILPTNKGSLNEVIQAGNKIVAIGSGNMSITATSTDGLNWNVTEFDRSIYISDLAFSGNTFVGVGNGIYSSKDAVNWSTSVSPNTLMYDFHTVEWSGYNYVAGGGGVYVVWVSP
jgi:hypothetical protein